MPLPSLVKENTLFLEDKIKLSSFGGMMKVFVTTKE